MFIKAFFGYDKMDWREKIDKIIKPHVEHQIKEASKERGAYLSADDPKNAQLWVAVGNLSKQIFELNLRLNYLERALRDIGKKNDEGKVLKRF